MTKLKPISIFELCKDGTYRSLPPYQTRATYVGGITRRRLLTPGARERLDWKKVRLASYLDLPVWRPKPGGR